MRRALIPAARWLVAHSDARAVVAVQDIGAIGYYADRRVLDLGGLVTPQITRMRRELGDENVIARGAFFAAGDAEFVFVRGPGADTLDHAPLAGRTLRREFAVDMPNLGVTRPGVARYTMYRVIGAQPQGASLPVGVRAP
jgi:hypothetical protein